MFSRTINFQKYIFQTTEEINMTLENSTIEDIVFFLKMFFYFECEEKLRRILTNEYNNNGRLIHVSVRPSNLLLMIYIKKFGREMKTMVIGLY